jgi:hypothetical protein
MNNKKINTESDVNTFEVRGYFKPESSFKTISEWEQIANQFLDQQNQGFDTRGGKVSDSPKLVDLINRNFNYQYYVEPIQFPKLSQKVVLDFIEDFVNYRVWEMRHDFEDHLPDVESCRFAYFYSRGNIEPYVLLDSEFTKNAYGSNDIDTVTYHWTTEAGLINLIESIKKGNTFPISTFTVQSKQFFRPESRYLVKLVGKLIAAFQSDTKSFSTDMGNKAANMYRFTLPNHEENLCPDWKTCTRDQTHLWNEIIVTPTGILKYKKVESL